MMMDWNTILKTLFTNRLASLSKTEAVNLIKTITRCEQEFFDDKSENLQFFMGFTVLAADKLSHCKLVCHSHLNQLQDACHILIRFIVHALPKATTTEIKWLLHALKCLCKANSNAKSNTTATNNTAANLNATLLQFDYNAVVAFLRTCKYPETVNTNQEKETASAAAAAGSTTASAAAQKTEAKPPRSDFSSIILKQLSAPLEPSKFIWTSLTEEYAYCSDFFAASNVSYFHSLNGVQTILQVCPCLNSFRQKYEASVNAEGGASIEFPLTSADALKIKSEVTQMSVDISILWLVLNMPLITQPLTAEQILDLSKCSLSALYIGMSVCMACSVLSMSNSANSNSNSSLKTEQNDTDEQARFIVDKTIEIYATIGEILQQNGRDYIYRNNLCCGAWILVTGIQAVLGATGAPTNINSKPAVALPRVNLFKVQQGFGVLNVAMANQCIKMLSELIDDLKLETDSENVDNFPEQINFDVLKPYTALQRVFHILNTVTFHQLFTFLATVSYRKSCALKRSFAKDRTVECEPASYSDSTTYFNDSLSCSDNSEDDSESYLGKWFKETLSPEANEFDANNLTEDMSSAAEARALKSNLIVDEPHEYLDLAAKIFKLLEQLHAHKLASLQHYVKICLSEQQMVLLANTLKDLDRESVKNGEVEVNVTPNWQAAMLNFSSTVSRYIHNLISTGLLNENLQTNLLQHLNLSPWSTENNSWPLQLYPSSLSVLVQILLLKPTQEKEAACLWIWHRLINTLVEKVWSAASLDGGYEDLNIEHAQLLLLLFHSLNLMQKKSILLLTAGGVISCAEVCRNISETNLMHNSQVVCLSRLLLFLEYLMKHLYNAPVELLDQVSWHLFSSNIMSNNSQQNQTDLYNKLKSKSFCYYDIEEAFRKSACCYISNIRPTFYSLTMLEQNLYSEFKLDGLAWNFILCTPDKLKYPLLVDALIDILQTVNMAQYAANAHANCAAKYCFRICWKLLLGLPPSSQHVEALMQPNPPNLHSLLWCVRCASSTAKFLISSSLIKQGMYTQLAQNMWNDVCAQVCGIPNNMQQTMLGFSQFIEQTQTTRPLLLQIILLDSLITRMLAVLRLEKEQPQRSIENIDEDKEEAAEATLTSNAEKSVAELSCELLQMLPTVYNSIMETLRQNMRAQLSDLGACPQMENILRIISKNYNANELSFPVVKLLTQRDSKIINEEWPKGLQVQEVSSTETNLKVEQLTLNSIEAQLNELTQQTGSFCAINSMKQLLYGMLQLANELIPLAADNAPLKPVKQLLVATILDARFVYLVPSANTCLATLLSKDSEQPNTLYLDYIVQHLYDIMLELCAALRETEQKQEVITFRENLLLACMRCSCSLFETDAGLQALQKFFMAEQHRLVELLLCYTGTNIPLSYVREHLEFFEKLFQAGHIPDKKHIFPMAELRNCYASLAAVQPERLKLWLKNTIYAENKDATPTNLEAWSNRDFKLDSIDRNGQLLLRLMKYLCADSQALTQVYNVLFDCCLQLCESLGASLLDTSDFLDLLEIMCTLADTAKINGHLKLFKASALWLKYATTAFDALNLQSAAKLQNISAILMYFNELLQSMGCKCQTFDDELLTPLDTDEITLTGVEDDFEYDNTNLSFEDDDENFNNKLCTFTQTQKEFMNQHWYHCHTCNMVNTVGVCSVCARVCHKTHDVSYAKYGNFFCDCGAKEDGSCQAITRRIAKISTTNLSEPSVNCAEKNLRNAQSFSNLPARERIEQLSKLLAGAQTQLQNNEQWLNIVQSILDFLALLMPLIRDNCAVNSNVGCHQRAQQALQQLHEMKHITFSNKEQLFVPTLGSQEGAFENVRMSYAGDQGQTIKQLISSGLVRRVTLCCLSAPQSKRQHLAVTLEKNKVTILQLSTLLKQADVAKRKLTLTQLAAAPINCTVLSLSANPVNEECLAVCGLKECHVLTFAYTGATNEHVVLTPQLENGNFIKKALWLPGAQTQLALVTADYVKIYDLAKDSFSPQYYFLLAVGKIRDCTFVYQHAGVYYILIMASSGYIYYQMLDQQSLAQHGDFYVTNTLELKHELITEDSGQLNGGGVSIYYSHQLQLLFFSHANGRNFMAPLLDVEQGLGAQLLLETVSNKTHATQALCQWTEIAGHPGLVCALLQSSNNPVIYMITPQSISYQEIKAQSSKTRIMDMVAIRHVVNEVEKTTLILLSEDGSLRIFSAQPEFTNFWLTPQLQPRDNHLRYLNGTSKKRVKKLQPTLEKSLANNANASVFPIDYFEHCTLLTDIEFGGNDLLQVYNKQKLKTRLLSAGMYVVCIKPNGFSLEIFNNDANMAIVGIRVLLGSQDVMRAPQNVNILGRIVNTPVRRARWFDLPLTREEILQADKCLKVVFGKSQDAENVCILDNIEVYGKSKELLVWPDDTDESANTATTLATNNNTGLKTARSAQLTDCFQALNPYVDNQLEKLLSNLLAVLDPALQLISQQNCAPLKKQALDLASALLLLPTTLTLQLQTRHMLATLFVNRTAYHNYKDHVILTYAHGELQQMALKAVNAQMLLDIDPEHFYRLLMLVRSVASARPQIFVKMCSELQCLDLVAQLKLCVEELFKVTPQVGEPTSIVRRGLCQPDVSVHYLTEIIYCCALSDGSQLACMSKYLLDLLMNPAAVISHSAKDALIFLLGTKVKRRKAAAAATASQESVALTQTEYVSEEQQLLNLDAVLGLRQSIGLQADADEDAIMDLAIALSLQQHGGENAANVSHVASTSQAGSDDDEASNIATDGSTLRTSPAEPAGSGGSESGGSCVESIGEQSGRSSSYGDPANTSPPRLVKQSEEAPSCSKTEVNAGRTQTSEATAAWDESNAVKLHELRLTILESIMQHINRLDNCNGVQAIPLAQVILMLVLDLNANSERDVKLLNDLIMTLIEYIGINAGNTANFMKDQNAKNEVRLVILCLFGVLMGKTKTKHTGGTSSPQFQFKDNATFVASTTASIMSNSGSFEFCMNILESLLQHWKNSNVESNMAGTPCALNRPAAGGSSSSSTSNNITAKGIQPQLLKSSRPGPKPDISNLIPHNYIKNYPDIFDNYEALLTEICVRLPYQIIRLTMVHPGVFDGYNSFCENMTYTLCEYMMLNINALLRRQVRKLLMYICGSKEKFRMYRDGHSLDVHFNYVMNTCGLHNTKNLILKNKNMPMLNYDSLVEITEHLRNCLEIAQLRTGNWQKFCLMHENVIPVLIEIACYKLDDGISPIVLQLLEAALCNTVQAVKQTATPSIQNISNVSVNVSVSEAATSSAEKTRTERAKSEEMPDNGHDSKFDPVHCSTFVHQIFRFVSDSLLNKFIRLFLLESNTAAIRWQAHSIVYALYDHGNERQKQKLITVLWNIWPLVRNFGRRAAQFVDILGYLTLNTRSIAHNLPEYTQMAIAGLRLQNELLAKHPNASIYATLEQILQMNGYYLESEPCLVCNNPEIPFSNIKLPSIKSDSKFTTTTMIVKLVQSHTISKLIVRIADLKRTKMVRTINIYYNNRTVQAVVELKNRPALWNKARSVTLQSGQTEVKIEFSLPITACNLMIEYADFYETVTGSSENLQCPRCSAAVPAYPGVCSNCGENVFQCHKCRAINYDEKDPFLCHSCGFCKYAKFDFSIYGRMCCSVDPIETAEDRAKTVQVIHSSLERADRIYRQLQTNQQMLELLIQKVVERRCPDRAVDENMGTVHNTSQVNKVIQLLAQKYCIESRASFEELSKIVQKVKACRSELVAYDQNQEGGPTPSTIAIDVRDTFSTNRCYGCALASMEQCLTLLRAMASNAECRVELYNQGLVNELATNNLRRGTSQIQDDVRNLLVLLTKNNKNACLSLLDLISERVKTALLGAFPLANLDSVVYHEMTLLEVLVGQDEFCWEKKVKVVFQLFFLTSRFQHGPIMSVLQPCLRILQTLLLPIASYNKANRERQNYENNTFLPIETLTIDYKKWMADDEFHSYNAWKLRMPYKHKQLSSKNSKFTKKEQNANSKFASLYWREAFLSEKYAKKWQQRVLNKKLPLQPMTLNSNWLQPIMFNTSSRFSRQLACSLVTALSNSYECKRELLNMLTSFLQYVGEYGEASGEFLALFKSLAAETPWRQYLAMRGVLTQVTQFLHAEIKKIHRLEETTLSSDLAQGYALCQFVDLLALFLECAAIRQTYKTRLLGPVLESYLSLRKLIIQRTHFIDDAQEKLLEMLEDMTSGTEEETRAFMAILINTVESSPIDDIKTPVFIFERLYSIIYPEEFDKTEFFMSLEKDAQQEDYLQGRMLGNPYGSNEVGLGPLMRDVKNKICTDCELIALLEDDNGMELLVNNKIISLDLPVKDVYKKVWLAEGGERDAMRIVYRMRGLLGDATEEFVESLSNKHNEQVDNEQLYRLANVLADCNGLQVMLQRLHNLQNISRTRELLQVLLKLFLICVKVRRCQQVLCDPKLGAINTLLQVLQLCLQSEADSTQTVITEQLLEIIECILSKAASDTLDSFLQFSLTFGGSEYISALISYTDCANMRQNAAVLRHLIHVLAALVYGNEVKMALLCQHFLDIMNFERFDAEHTSDEEFKLELFCVLTAQIENNCIGATLKDYIIRLGIVDRAIEYIVSHAPCVKPTLLRTDSDELKEFISRPSLKYVLRFLTGLAQKHEATQLAISKHIIPIIHRLEQVSSDEHVGSLAENLLEALCTHEEFALRVQEVRDFTRAEKKRLAMATREKQLDALGMRTNEKGQVTAKGAILSKIEKLRDETGLICFICREGYACQPSKVLGIYTFTKRCSVEEYELKARKTIGYTTVTHFNVVHVDCHTAAIRLARGRDEWERASLQNANTRCNGLLPLWGPDVSEAAFSGCMTRHSSYMQESTQRCEVSFSTSMHDLKLLLMRFAWERSFHEDAGGGGPQSNMHFVPYLLFYAVYLLLSSRSAARDSKLLASYLQAPASEKWLESAYEVEGPLYMVTLSLALNSFEQWQQTKLAHLRRLLAIAHVRQVSPGSLCTVAQLSREQLQVKSYGTYKPYLMLWALVDLIYTQLFKSVVHGKEQDWHMSLFDYIRIHDEDMLKSTDAILSTFTDEFLPCSSFDEFCDVAGLLHTIENPTQYLEQLLNQLVLATDSATTATATA